MSILEDLRAVRDLLTDSRHWTKNCSARDQLGQPINSRNPNAKSWCLWGAGRKITHGRSWTDLDSFLGKQFKSIDPHTHYSRWNDKQDIEHKDVMAFVDDTIEQAKKRV